jgi:hypothetical protein
MLSRPLLSLAKHPSQTGPRKHATQTLLPLSC